MAVRPAARRPLPTLGSPAAGGEPQGRTLLLRLINVTLRIRGRHLLVLDAVGTLVGALFALVVSSDRPSLAGDTPSVPLILVLLVSVRLGVNVLVGLYSRRWRYASVPELERIVGAAALGSLVAIAVFYGTDLVAFGSWTDGYPRAFWPLELMASVGLLGGVRFAIRAAGDHRQRRVSLIGSRRPTLLYGAGDAGVLVARNASRYPATGVYPVGFLDDNPELANTIVAGIKVHGGIDALEHAIALTGARSLLITMPSATGGAVRRIVERGLELGLDVRTVPSVSELIDGSIEGYRVRKVRVEDLLRRPIVTEHAVNVEDLIRGRTVVVTGGGGSIGSELARQVYAMRPRRLVLVDRAESPLYLVQRELETMRDRGRGGGELRIHLANVASRAAMDRLIGSEMPSVIFHAAAYKHVPMMEEHPSDAAFVNMGGTMVLLDAAAAAGVERFVFVSTDKAVRPSSIMGASKRIGEMLVADTARATGRPYVSVRFGNVLGSTGSVVPIFQEQLENGQPLTITDPEMTRYFMTIPEAAWLILDAAALGRTGDLFVLDMGEPVKVLDLARDLVRLSGRDPNSQPVEVVGLRPGEKLHEELFYDSEAVEPTLSPKVRRADAALPPYDVRERVRAMLGLAMEGRELELREAIMDYVRSAGDPEVAAVPEAHVLREAVPVMAPSALEPRLAPQAVRGAAAEATAPAVSA